MLLPDAPGAALAVGPAVGPVVGPACVVPVTLLAFAGPVAGELDAWLFVILPNGVRGGADIVDKIDKAVSTDRLLFSMCTLRSKIVVLVLRVLTLCESCAENVVELGQ